jgi:endonuclease/exonuclease/phosphatase family metal-dependent hydrolase
VEVSGIKSVTTRFCGVKLSGMSAESLRIVSYNVRYFGHALRGLASTQGPKRSIASRLLALNPLPDIICLQEVETRSLRSTLAFNPRDERETQLEAFMRRMQEVFGAANREMPYEAFYFRAHTYRLSELPLYTTGLATLVNVKKLKVFGSNIESPHSITHHHVERLKDAKQSRICAHLEVECPSGKRLHVFNTHLSLPTPFAREFWSSKDKMGFGSNQVHEARRLSEYIHKLAGKDAFVVCGDFNSAPGSPVYRLLTQEARFIGAQERTGCIDCSNPRAFATAGFMRLRMHLDHIFSSESVTWHDCEGTTSFGPQCAFHGCSDHVPIIGRFSL